MYIKVRAQPKAKKETFEKISDEFYKIAVKEKAERNLANKRILEILSEKLKTPLKDIQIINGHHSRSKLISIKEKRND